MRRALGGKLKLEFIDGSIPVPTDQFDPSFRSWNRCNMLVHSWIMNYVSESIAQSIIFIENAFDVWIDLKEHFTQSDLVRISELQQEIYALKQDSRTVTEFYSALKLLWEELEIYLPMPNCSYRIRCTCEAMHAARANHSLLHIVRFLISLNDEFSVVKSQVLLIDPLPSLNKVFSMVLQHERQGNFYSSDESKALLNAAKSKGFSSSKVPVRICTFCGKDNHIVENCFKKYGIPPHMKRNSTAHNAAIEGGIDEPIAQENTQGPPITQDQALQLISLLQSLFSNPGSNTATYNQVGSVDLIGPSSKNQDGLYYLKLTSKDVHAYAVDGSDNSTIPETALSYEPDLAIPFPQGNINTERDVIINTEPDGNINTEPEPTSPIAINQNPVSTYDIHDIPYPHHPSSPELSNHDNSSIPLQEPINQPPNHTIPDQQVPTHRPIRDKHAQFYLSDYVCNQSITSSTPSSSGILYPISSFHSFQHLSPVYHAFTTSITHNTEPKSYLEACQLE
ncbi:hypothetical protein TSUD_292900 [Trifolium subterraneum]|uniref:Retrotransposon gag domain-containing protein n=1 Tax=Trifolium subterraneum TaxID=3900 RepID=A0A2Z6NI49_TRISU|nr:hypothetical protein TSUD_292900 [Trifolium subterraneum]